MTKKSANISYDPTRLMPPGLGEPQTRSISAEDKGNDASAGQRGAEVIDLTSSDRDSPAGRMTKKTANISYDPTQLMPPGLREPQTPSARIKGVHNGKRWRLTYTDNVESPEEKMARLPKYAWPPAPRPQSRKRKLDQLYIAAESADPNASMNAPTGDMRLGRLLNSHYI